MLIILEGVDGSGKSTLAQALARRLGKGTARRWYTAVRGQPFDERFYGETTVLSRGPLERHPLEEYELDLDLYVPGQETHVICDRWHLGELVYGPLYRDESRLTPAMRRHVELFLASRGAVVVFVDAQSATLRKRLDERGEDFLQAHHVTHVRDSYRDLGKDPSPVARYHTSAELLEERGDEIIGELHDVAEWVDGHAHRAWFGGRYCGPPRPDALLVGEETSPKHLRGDRPMYRAPFVPYSDGSGRFLLDALPDDLWYRVGILNALENDLEEACRRLRPRVVIGLGRTAQSELARCGIGAECVPHPQYVRRFKHASLPEYGQQIKELVWPSRS